MAKKIVFSDLKSGQQLKINLKGKTNLPYRVKKDEVRFVVVGTTENTNEKVLIPAFTKEDLENKAKIISEERAVDVSSYVPWKSVTSENFLGFAVRTPRFLDDEEIYLLTKDNKLKKFNDEYQTEITSLNFYDSDAQNYDFNSPELNQLKLKIREKLLKNQPEKIVLPIIEDNSLLEQASQWGVINTENSTTASQKKIDNFITKMQSEINLATVFDFTIYLQDEEFTKSEIDLNEFITSDVLIKTLNDKTGNILQTEELKQLAAEIVEVSKDETGNEYLVISVFNKDNPATIVATFSVLFQLKKFSNENLLYNLVSGRLAVVGFRTLNIGNESAQQKEISKLLNSKITEINEEKVQLEKVIDEEQQNFTKRIINEELGRKKQKLLNSITEKIVFVNKIQKINFLQELIIDNVKQFLIAAETFLEVKQLRTALLPALEKMVKFKNINNDEIKSLLSENFTELVELHKLCPPAFRECFGASFQLVNFLNNFKKYEINKVVPNLFVLDYSDTEFAKRYNGLLTTKKNRDNEKAREGQEKIVFNIDNFDIDALTDMYIDDFPHHKFNLSEHFLLKEQFGPSDYEDAKIKFVQIIDELALETAEEAQETEQDVTPAVQSKFYVELPEVEKTNMYEELKTKFIQIITALKAEEETKTQLLSYDEAKEKINEIIKQLQQKSSATELEVYERLKLEFNEVIDQLQEQVATKEFKVHGKIKEKIDKVLNIITLQQEEASGFSGKLKNMFQTIKENVRIKQGKWEEAEMLTSIVTNVNEITDSKKIIFRVIKNYDNKKFLILYNAGTTESPLYKITTITSENIVGVEKWENDKDLPTLHELWEMQAVINEYLSSKNPLLKETVDSIFEALQKRVQVIYFDKNNFLNIAEEWQWKANLEKVISKLPTALQTEIKKGTVKIDFSEDSKKRVNDIDGSKESILLNFTVSLKTADNDLNLAYKTKIGSINFLINRDSNFLAKTRLKTISQEISSILEVIDTVKEKRRAVITNLTKLLTELTNNLKTKRNALEKRSNHTNFKLHRKNKAILQTFDDEITVLLSEIQQIKNDLLSLQMLEKNDNLYNEFIKFFNDYRAASPVSPHDFEKYRDWEKSYEAIKDKLYNTTRCEDFANYQKQTIKCLDNIENKINQTEDKLKGIISNKKSKFKKLSFIKKLWNYISWTLKSTRKKIADIRTENENIFTFTNEKVNQELQNINVLTETVISQEAKMKEPQSCSSISSGNDLAAMVNETLPPVAFEQNQEQLTI